MSIYEYVGNPHVHTCYSDGAGLHAGVAEAAARAGLDFVIVTDHNLWVDGVEGYYGGVLLLVGEEIHDVRRRPPGNHLLAYRAEGELAPMASDPQALVDEVNRRDGLCYLAHPFELGSPIHRQLNHMPGKADGAFPWTDWQVEGYTGIELWNYMSEFKGLLRNRVAALVHAYSPTLGIRGPFRATLRQWDELLEAGRRIAVIGGADAHGKTYSLGPLTRKVLPYEYLFRCVNTHVLTSRPFTGDPANDKALIYEGFRLGRTWVGYDLPVSTSGFRFRARSGANEALMGGELVRTGAVVLEVQTPEPSDTRLLCHGAVVARSKGCHLKFTTAVAGPYRVEVYRRYRLQRRGWIFSSPIYVN